jgi:hypothetical protein
MTKFNPENKENLTYGDCLDPIFKIKDKEDALQYKRAYIEYMENEFKTYPNTSAKSAEEIANHNIGYYAGYGSNDDRERIEELFECSHPIFGSVKENGVPTAKEAFNLGKNKNK